MVRVWHTLSSNAQGTHRGRSQASLRVDAALAHSETVDTPSSFATRS